MRISIVPRFIAQILAWRESCKDIEVIIPKSSKTTLIMDIGSSLPIGLRGVFNEGILYRVRAGLPINEAAGYALSDIMDMIDEIESKKDG